ncbi:hypothetical protein F4778DRAFT_752971 [Xylariomycetidae sp. FL2044]|nr:hypothetical protein F4778DRAFT_752971 [Xylariomycetidae sp. FL2044]
MSSASGNEGRQSPPPETQTGAQLKETPASGQGVNAAENKKDANADQLKNLPSNPKGTLDDAVDSKFSKDTKPSS